MYLLNGILMDHTGFNEAGKPVGRVEPERDPQMVESTGTSSCTRLPYGLNLLLYTLIWMMPSLVTAASLGSQVKRAMLAHTTNELARGRCTHRTGSRGALAIGKCVVDGPSGKFGSKSEI